MRDQPRLLLVEDNADLAAETVEYLQRHGFAVRSVPHAEAARSALIEHLLDIALVDVRLDRPGLPREDGHDLCEYVHRAHPETATIIWTAFPADPVREATLSAQGLHGYLDKSMASEELLRTLRNVLLHQRRRREQELGWYVRAVSAACHRMGNDLDRTVAGIELALREEMSERARDHLVRASRAAYRGALLVNDLQEWSSSHLLTGEAEGCDLGYALRAASPPLADGLSADRWRLLQEGDPSNHARPVLFSRPALEWVLSALLRSLVHGRHASSAADPCPVRLCWKDELVSLLLPLERVVAGSVERNPLALRPFVESIPEPEEARVLLPPAKLITEIWRGRLFVEEGVGVGAGVDRRLRLDLPLVARAAQHPPHGRD